MAWIKADHRFGMRGTIFYLPIKAMLMEQQLYQCLLRGGNQSPELIEQYAVEAIERYRPELKGCTVWAMDWSIRSQRWEFCVSHGSLPAPPPGEELPCRPLDPAYERDLEASKSP